MIPFDKLIDVVIFLGTRQDRNTEEDDLYKHALILVTETVKDELKYMAVTDEGATKTDSDLSQSTTGDSISGADDG